MQLKKLFNLLHDAQDFAAYFEEVTSPTQLVSRLDRLKRGEAAVDVFDCLEALRLSLAEAFDDQLEMGGNLADDDDTETDNILESLPDDNASDAQGQPTTESTTPTSTENTSTST